MDPERSSASSGNTNVFDAPRLAKVMDDLAAAHPLVEGAAAGTPVLPVMAD